MAILVWLAAVAVAVAEGLATARVVEVEKADSGLVVVLNAGQQHGLAADAQVTLLRQAEPIVHPLTGEVLGVPQEPVGVAQVVALGAQQTRGRLIKTYVEPVVGDLAEYERQTVALAEPQTVALEERQVATVAPPPPPAGAEVGQVLERMTGLEQDLAQYRQSQKAVAAYPVFARQVWDELKSVKSYLIALDERLVELENHQGEDRNRLNAVLSGEYRAEEMREFTIRYSPDTDVRLKVAGKTLVLEVVRDSLHLEPVEAGELALEELPVEQEEGKKEGLDLSFFSSPYVQAGSLGIILALAGVLFFLMKRRDESFMEELDSLDDLDEEDEEEYRTP